MTNVEALLWIVMNKMMCVGWTLEGYIKGLIREGELNQGRGWGNREKEAIGKRVLGWDSEELGLVLLQTSFCSFLPLGWSLPLSKL